MDYLTYTVDTTPRNYPAVEFTIGYRRSAEQMAAMIHATSISALEDLLETAVERGASELTVRLNYFENRHAEVESIVSRVRREMGAEAAPWQIHFYPATGDVGIIEILLDP